jgi:hypothetical protein
MTITFRPAVRTTTALLIALAGSSGSGKTYSALRLARGLAGPNGKIAFIDTERGRALHYAEAFTFDHAEIHPPFRPDRYQQAILDAEKADYPVIVVDSMSHEHSGEGGLVDWAAMDLQKMGSPRNWIAPKTAHKKLVNRLLQVNAHLIFCLRAEPKIKMVEDPKRPGRQMVVDDGWKPVCEKTFMYEMICSFMLYDERPGVPVPTKLQAQHKSAFPAGQQITEACGAALATWAAGAKPPAPAATASGGGPEAGPTEAIASEPAAEVSVPSAAGTPSQRQAVQSPLDDDNKTDWPGYRYLVEQELAGCGTPEEIDDLKRVNQRGLDDMKRAARDDAKLLSEAFAGARLRVTPASQEEMGL